MLKTAQQETLPMTKHRSDGFTLIELLVVIAIIGIVAGLSIPAVQSARESSRRTYCTSQLGQIVKGIVQYETQHRYFPSGGWGKDWLGSDGRTGRSQPSGWVYAVLPFVEEQVVYEGIADHSLASYSTLVASPIGLFACPTRRAPVARKVIAALPFNTEFGAFNLGATPEVAKTDYAINGGSVGGCSGATDYANALPDTLRASSSVPLCSKESGALSGVSVVDLLENGSHGYPAAPDKSDKKPLSFIGDCAADENPFLAQSPPLGVAPDFLKAGMEWARETKAAGAARTFGVDYGIPAIGNGIAHRMSQVTAGNVLKGSPMST